MFETLEARFRNYTKGIYAYYIISHMILLYFVMFSSMTRPFDRLSHVSKSTIYIYIVSLFSTKQSQH